MIQTRFLLILIIIVLIFSGFLFFKENTNSNGIITTTEKQKNCIPTFLDGGGPYYKPNSPFREKIVPDKNNGEKLIVKGKVLQNDCKTPVANAVIDLWQANETGNYQDEWYRGKIRTGGNGTYQFESVVPKGYGEGTGYRPPHIHFKVFINDVEIITSQMFFPEAKEKPGFEDAYIMSLTSKNKIHTGQHNIILP
ncbi:MAG TPA: hypothetical protein VK338_01800 [Candidatus Nitrosocosmicus sp.]|nr:hypothetical protein [Candidatus Nitrosocosmicus sp.]